MTKSKKNFFVVFAIVLSVVILGSVFAIVSFTKPQTVEAATETRAPGLYATGSTTPTKTWQQLLDDKDIIISNGELKVDTSLAGDLIFGEVSGLTILRNVFYRCPELTSIDCSKLDTSKVTNMGGMFNGCSSLTSLDVSSFNTSNVTDMGGMFINCSSLTSLDISNFDTSNVSDMSLMFLGCSSLKSLDVSKFNTSNVIDMHQMFDDCISLKSINFGSHFYTNKATDMGLMFYGCSSLTSLDISNFDTSNVTDMQYMFYGCTALKSLDVSGFDTSKVKNFTAMFGGTKLTVLDMSNFTFGSLSGATNVMGMLGINDTYCLGVLNQYASSLVQVYQMAMQNQDISSALSSVSFDLAVKYINAIAGKSSDEVGYIGRVYVVGIVINKMFYSGNSDYMERALVDAQTLFDTKIGTIYAPANASSLQISLPYNVNYVYKLNDTNTALPAQILYGYNDIDSSLTELALFEGTLDEPATKPSETPISDTGVATDITMIIIALASILSLAVVATKKKRVAR